VAVVLVAAAVGVLFGGAGLVDHSIGAQEPPTTVAPVVAAVPVDPAATVPVDPAATAPPPSQVLPSTTNIVPLNCTPIAPPFLVFAGRITAYQIPTFRFKVDQVVAGTWDGPLVDVDFPNDAGFLRLGPTYLVAAQVDAATGKLFSKVRYTFRTQPGPGTCPGDDPIITRLADGTPVDTGLLSGMKGRWSKVLTAFVVPSIAIIGALVLLVSLKHLVTRVLRTSPVSSRRPYSD
jgi:hypothetical protein